MTGPGIGDYAELEKILPKDYHPLLTPKETQKAILQLRRYIEDNLCKQLGLQMVQVPLIVDAESGVNDMLDRDGSRTPIQFHISNDRDKHPIDAQVVQAATKWKRVALKRFECRAGEGICTDMRAVRKDYFLDHDHSAYVDQWDWERVITAEQRNVEFLKLVVGSIWKVLIGAEKFAQELFPRTAQSSLSQSAGRTHISACRRIACDVSRPAPQAPRDRHSAKVSRDFHYRHRMAAERRIPARDARRRLRRLGYRYESRNAPRHSLNGDILVWNHVTQRRHELSSMGIRVNAETLRKQLEMSNLLDNLKFPYHQGIIHNELPLSIGGGIGQSRTLMLLLRKAHLGEVSVTVWPKVLKAMCSKRNIFVLE